MIAEGWEGFPRALQNRQLCRCCCRNSPQEQSWCIYPPIIWVFWGSRMEWELLGCSRGKFAHLRQRSLFRCASMSPGKAPIPWDAMPRVQSGTGQSPLDQLWAAPLLIPQIPSPVPKQEKRFHIKNFQ